MKATRGEKIFYTLNHIFLGLFSILCLIPFYMTFVRALAPQSDYYVKELVLYPSKIQFDYLRLFFTDPGTKIGLAYRNTVFITIFGTLINMFFTIITGYALAERRMPLRLPITMIFLIPMFIGGSLAPSYILYAKLGLLNSLWVLIIPGAMNVGNTLLMRNFIMQLPEEIKEAATIDGCSKVKVIWYVVMPLSQAAIATISLFFAVGHWNQYSSAVYFISPAKADLIVLQVYLRNLINDVEKINTADFVEGLYKPAPEGLKAAATLCITIPIMCVYPFIQKYFVKGVVVGSLKG